jgi:hypothetical protein
MQGARCKLNTNTVASCEIRNKYKIQGKQKSNKIIFCKCSGCELRDIIIYVGEKSKLISQLTYSPIYQLG